MNAIFFLSILGFRLFVSFFLYFFLCVCLFIVFVYLSAANYAISYVQVFEPRAKLVAEAHVMFTLVACKATAVTVHSSFMIFFFPFSYRFRYRNTCRND